MAPVTLDTKLHIIRTSHCSTQHCGVHELKLSAFTPNVVLHLNMTFPSHMNRASYASRYPPRATNIKTSKRINIVSGRRRRAPIPDRALAEKQKCVYHGKATEKIAPFLIFLCVGSSGLRSARGGSIQEENVERIFATRSRVIRQCSTREACSYVESYRTPQTAGNSLEHRR